MGQFHTRGFDEPATTRRPDACSDATAGAIRPRRRHGLQTHPSKRSRSAGQIGRRIRAARRLEEANYPVYFHEFVERAGACGLQYICEALAARSPPRGHHAGSACEAREPIRFDRIGATSRLSRRHGVPPHAALPQRPHAGARRARSRSGSRCRSTGFCSPRRRSLSRRRPSSTAAARKNSSPARIA